MQYVICIPTNESLERDIVELLARPVGRPSHKPVTWYDPLEDPPPPGKKGGVPNRGVRGSTHVQLMSARTVALTDAATVSDQSHLYAAMVAAGALHIQCTFSWQKNKSEYDRQIARDVPTV